MSASTAIPEPDTLQTLLYPAPLEKDQFRLLKCLGFKDSMLACSLNVVEFPTRVETRPRYDALSYVWGDQIQSQKFLNCNGHQIQVTKNLHAALYAIWSTNRNIRLWADALCINQADSEEKSVQVARMHHIYSNASCVRVWLGEADEDVVNMLPCLPQYDQLEDTSYDDNRGYAEWECSCLHHTGPTAEPKEICLHRLPRCLVGGDPRIKIWSSVLHGLNNLLSRAWFGRSWTMQEAILARRAVMHFGTYTMEWIDFRRRCMISDGSGLQIRNYLVQEVFAAQEATIKRKYGMSQLLVLAWPREAHDPRDKVFSLFGLLPNQPFKIDYTRSLRDIYISAARACITTERTLRVLSAAGLVGDLEKRDDSPLNIECKWIGQCSHVDGHCDPGGVRTHISTLELPSWVPDWRATNCKVAVAPTDWYMTTRNIDSTHIGRALPQDIEDSSNCLIVTGVVLGRFSSHPSVNERAIYAEDGKRTSILRVSNGAITELPPCTASCLSEHIEIKPLDNEVMHAGQVNRLSHLVRKHDLRQCECSHELREQRLISICWITEGLPKFCKDGDWVCILDGSSAPSILRPERPIVIESSCKQPQTTAFIFVGNMRSRFAGNDSKIQRLLTLRSDPLVTHTDEWGIEELTSESLHTTDIERLEGQMPSDPKSWHESDRKVMERMKQWRRVQLAEGVFHLH